MKRMQADKAILSEKIAENNIKLPGRLKDTGEYFSLLYDVPLPYLIPSPDFLPPESLRFFYVDENFVAAMQNGFLSVARNSSLEKTIDRAILPAMVKETREGSGGIRAAKVHKNHHEALKKVKRENAEIRSGFLLRSALVYRRKGLVIAGFHEQEKLGILRLETLNREIMLGIFDGELTSLTITEPQCGLRFGWGNRDGKKEILSIENIGKPLDGCTCSAESNERGRVNVTAAAKQLENALREKGELQEELPAHLFAYEMFLAAQRAEFLKVQEG